jgi:hypothetical protein
MIVINTKIFLITILFLFDPVYSFAEYEELRQISRDEFETLSKLSLIRPVLAFDESSESYSSALRKGGRITISLPELNAMVSAYENRFKRSIVRMVIAHEFGHAIQYAQKNISDKSLIGECQADLISGFFLFQMMLKDIILKKQEFGQSETNSPLPNADQSDVKDNLLTLYSTIFNLGDDNSVSNSHPRGRERMTAIRFGFEWGALWLTDLQSKDNSLSPDQRGIQINLLKLKKSSLGYLQDDNIMTWSQRTAIKIVHEDLSICKDIVVNENLRWNTSSAHPFLYYNQHIRNIGKNRITITYFNQLYFKNRKDPRNLLLWDLQNATSKLVTLEPGMGKTVIDSLRWFASEDNMPGFIGLGSENGLYTCRILQKKLESSLPASPDRFSANKKNLDPETVLDIIFSYIPGKISNLIAGVGREDEINATKIYYPSQINFPDAESTLIYYIPESKSYSIEVTVCNGKSKTLAETELKTLLQTFRKIGKEMMLVESKEKSLVYVNKSKGPDVSATIKILKNNSGTYTVNFNIRD